MSAIGSKRGRRTRPPGADARVATATDAGMLDPQSAQFGSAEVDAGVELQPALTLTRWEGPRPRSTPIPLTSSLKSRMAMAIQPGLNFAGHAHSANTAYKIVFKPAVAEALQDGSASLLGGEQGHYLTAMKNGKFAGNGQVVLDKRVRNAAAIAAVFDVLAVVTSQKFLADIDQKLAAIVKGVEAIEKWLDAEARGKLHAGLNYLNSIAPTIRQNRLTSPEITAFLTQLETIDQDGYAIAQLYLDKLNRIEHGLPAVTTSLWPQGAEKDAALLYAADDDWHRSAHGVVLALRLRGAAAQLRCSLPVDRAPSEHRLDSIMASLAAMQERRKSFERELDTRASALRSHGFPWVSKESKHSFVQRTQQSSQKMQVLAQDTRAVLTTLRGGLTELDLIDRDGMVLLVTLDDHGDIDTVGHVEAHAQSAPAGGPGETGR